MPIPAGSGSGPAPAGLSYDPVLSRVRLSVQVPSSAAYALVERSTDQVRWSTVRGAAQVTPTVGGTVSVSDYEFAADVVNYYRVRAFQANDFEIGPAKNTNPVIETDTYVQGDFEVDMTGWTGVNATVARSTAQAHLGVASAFVSPSGSGVVARVEAALANALPAVPGQSFTASAWVRPTGATKPAAVQITWRDAGGAFLSSTVATAAATAGAWQSLSVTGTAPASAAWAEPAAGIGSTPTLTDTAYVDELRLSTPASWTGNGGTVARSTVQAHEGAASLLLTPDGVSSVAQARAANVPVTAGNFYVASAWLRSTVARTAGISIIWRDAGGAILSQMLGPTVSMSAGVWTYHEVIGQAPVGATQATFVAASMSGTPPTSNTMHIDEAYFVVVGGTPVWSGSITPILGGVWLKSIARPFLNRQVTVRDFSEVTRPARAGIFDVVGRSYPVAVTDVRGSRRWSLQLSTDNPEDADDLDLMLVGGGTLLVHVPPDAGRISAVPGGYVTVGDTRMVTPPTYDLRMRVLELPLTEVAAPGPDVVGSTVTCQTVLNAYATVQAMLDAHPTVTSLLELVGDPTDVVVP